jgi:hypothetical protein
MAMNTPVRESMLGGVPGNELRQEGKEQQR